MNLISAALLCVIMAGSIWGWAKASAAVVDNLPATMQAPQIKGWHVIDRAGGHPWQPRFDNADRRYLWRYKRDQGGQELDLAIAAFAGQHEGKELVGFGQGGLDVANKWAWSENLKPLQGSQFEQFAAPGPILRTVATWYRVGDTMTASKSQVKLLTLKQRLTAGDQRAAALLISVERHAGDKQPEELIADFLAGSPGVDALTDKAMGQ